MLRSITLALCALGALAPSLAAAQEPRCDMKMVGELPVTLDASNRPFIPGTINGQPIEILASTSGDATFITQGLAEKLGLRVVPDDTVRIYTGGNAAQLAGMVTVESFGVGSTVRRSQRLSVWPGETPLMVLGRAFWAQADIEFDLAHKAIRLFRPENCSGKPLVYWGPDFGELPMVPGSAPDGGFIVEVKLNDRALQAKIASSAPSSIVTTEASREVGLPVTGPGAKAIGSADPPEWLGAFSSFTIGDETIRNARMRISDVIVPPGVKRAPLGSRVGRALFVEPPMVLGADFLRSHRVLLSNSQKKLYFSYAGGPVFNITGPLTARDGEGGAQ